MYDLTSMTEQEVFDAVVNHLLTQNQKSAIYDNEYSRQCLYHGPNGLKCAAGIFIAEGQLLPECGNCTWLTLVEEGVVPPNNQFLIRHMQQIHDDDDVDMWTSRLHEYAWSHNLKFNPPSN